MLLLHLSASSRPWSYSRSCWARPYSHSCIHLRLHIPKCLRLLLVVRCCRSVPIAHSSTVLLWHRVVLLLVLFRAREGNRPYCRSPWRCGSLGHCLDRHTLGLLLLFSLLLRCRLSSHSKVKDIRSFRFQNLLRGPRCGSSRYHRIELVNQRALLLFPRR